MDGYIHQNLLLFKLLEMQIIFICIIFICDDEGRNNDSTIIISFDHPQVSELFFS